MFKSFKDLNVWKTAHQLVLSVYKKTKNFPNEEKYGLISQIRRAAASVPTNIVAGKARSSRKEYLHFLHISRGSLEEVKYLILLSHDIGYLDSESYNSFQDQLNEVGRLLNALIKSLR